ncbi:hypothetical protein OROGR_019590 [Orobanche gracilis]
MRRDDADEEEQENLDLRGFSMQTGGQCHMRRDDVDARRTRKPRRISRPRDSSWFSK